MRKIKSLVASLALIASASVFATCDIERGAPDLYCQQPAAISSVPNLLCRDPGT